MSASINGTTISLTRGDTLKLQVSMTRGGEEYIPALDDRIRFALKKKVTDDETLILKNISPSDLILELKPEDTKSLSFGSYKYDIELTTSGGDVDTFIGPATFNITEEVH